MRPIDEDLFDASKIGDLEKAKRAIEEGADVNAKRKCGERANLDAKGGEYPGETPLHAVSTYGHENIISLLLEHGADVNAENDGGDTPLHAANNSDADQAIVSAVVSLLLEKGANVMMAGHHFIMLAHVDMRPSFLYCWKRVPMLMPKMRMKGRHFIWLA